MSYDQPESDPMFATDEAAMAAQDYEPSFMSNDHQIRHNFWQQPQSNPLPDFWSTLGAARSTYRPVLSSYQHAEQMRVELTARYNIQNTITTDIPNLDLDGEKWVRLLHIAVYDFSQTFETPGSQHYKNISRDDHYPEGVMHIMLWELVHDIVKAQQGICRLPPWYTTDGPIYKAYPSFVERFQEVELALRVSKACCCSLFSSSEFAARLAWNPCKELKRKRTNQSLNFAKATVQAIGLQTCRQRGISRNEDGEFEDMDGNTVARKEDGPSALALSLRNSFNKQESLSERAQVTSKLIVPVMTPDPEPEQVFINEYQDSLSEPQTGSTPSPGYFDDVDFLLARISRPNTNTTYAFPGETNTEQQSLFSSQLFLEPQAYLDTQTSPNSQLSLVSHTSQQPQIPQPARATQQAQVSQQQQTSLQMPVKYPYPQVESRTALPLVDHPHESRREIASQVNYQQQQYVQQLDNTQNANNPWLRRSTHNLWIPGDASPQQPKNGDEEEDDDSYSGDQGNINSCNPDISRHRSDMST